MGRNCGYLATMGGILGGAEFIVIPERPTTLEEIGKTLEDAYMRGKSHAMGVVAEGANLKTHEIAEYLENHEVGFEVRVTALGHVVRGGSPALSTGLLATRMGVAAVDYLLEGEKPGYNGRPARARYRDGDAARRDNARALVTESYVEMADMLPNNRSSPARPARRALIGQRFFVMNVKRTAAKRLV